MNLRSLLWFPPLLAIGQVIITAETASSSVQSRPSKKDEIIALSYCDLVKNQMMYDKKLVRVNATLLTWLDGTSLYDRGCGDVGLEPVIDCNDEEKCSAMRKILAQKTDFDGDVARVEVVLIGKLVVSLDTPAGKSRSKLKIKSIERVTRIPRGVPWPRVRS
jgi:hypothetical protein